MSSREEMKKNILIMGLVDFSKNPRPNRLIRLLKSTEHRVDGIGFALSSPIDIDQHYALKEPCAKLFSKIKRKIIRVIQNTFGAEIFRDVLNDDRWGLQAIENDIQNNLIMISSLLKIFTCFLLLFVSKETLNLFLMRGNIIP